MTIMAGTRFVITDCTASVAIPAQILNVGVSHYPLAQSATYVKATSELAGGANSPYIATNPLISLIGGDANRTWMSVALSVTNQRFHIDLGTPHVINRIYYENFHSTGGDTDIGAQNFTFWGSNVATSFAELTYGVNTGWVQLTTSQATFDQHAAANAADPKYLTATNTTAYRYYAFKFSDNYGNATWMGVRRIELQYFNVIHRIAAITIQPKTYPVYIAWDGADADATGLELAANDIFRLEGYENITQFRVVDTAAGAATLEVIPEYRV